MKWLRQLFFLKRRYDDLSVSIQEHLEEKVDELMEDGMSREEAVHAALREFGNVTLIEERLRHRAVRMCTDAHVVRAEAAEKSDWHTLAIHTQDERKRCCCRRTGTS